MDLTNYELYNIIYDKKMRCEPALFERFVEATGSINTLSGYFDSYTHLAETGKNCGTDKFTHGYLPKYEFFLNKFKNEKINILELGVYHGSSIHMWAQYFERAEIFGCDISPQTFKYHDERIHINILDLSKPSSYPILAARQYRIILDDASHYHDHQLLAFFNLFPYVEKGGIYIIEDLQTSFPPNLANYIHGSNDNTVNVLLHLAELVCGENRTPLSIDSYHNILKSFSPEIACISFIAKSCIIIKK